MKNEVVVNGVKLTREQVEEALKELNAAPAPQGGDIVAWGGLRALVLGHTLNRDLEANGARYRQLRGTAWIRVTDGVATFTPTAAEVTVVGHIDKVHPEPI